MNLNYIDMVIKRYQSTLDAGDTARLSFFRKLWGVADTCSALPQPSYQVPDPAVLHKILQRGESVLKTYPVAIDSVTLGETLRRLVECALAEGGFPSSVCDALKAVNWSAAVSQSNLDEAGAHPVTYLADFADQMHERGLDETCINLATALCSMALRVQLEPVAHNIVDAIDADELAKAHSLTCPVCGTDPLVARVGGENATDGRGKVVGCLQCGTSWDFERIRCSRCGTTHQRHLHYYNLEGDDAHRICTCDECGGYMRTVFVENSLAPVSFEVEDVVMAKLDALATDPRYHS